LTPRGRGRKEAEANDMENIVLYKRLRGGKRKQTQMKRAEGDADLILSTLGESGLTSTVG